MEKNINDKASKIVNNMSVKKLKIHLIMYLIKELFLTKM